MNQSQKSTYNTLITDITSLYEQTRLNFVKMYWSIGKLIDKVEQDNKFKTKLEVYIINRLSKDLTEKYGKGFSLSNLKNMRQFYKMYTFGQISGQIEWSNYVALLKVKEPEKRKALEKRITNDRLTNHQLRRMITSQHLSEQMKESKSREAVKLKAERGHLHTYSLIEPSRVDGSDGMIVVDCGFNIWKSILDKNDEELTNEKFITSKKNKGSFNIKPAGNITTSQIYTYKAYIEKIIDGDTLWAVIDCGFYTSTRQKLRLRGIDVPELNTKEGREAKSFVARTLKDSPCIIIKTHKYDKYDRYLSDIYYLPGEENIEKINQEGVFLNQELLDKGLAVVM